MPDIYRLEAVDDPSQAELYVAQKSETGAVETGAADTGTVEEEQVSRSAAAAQGAQPDPKSQAQPAPSRKRGRPPSAGAGESLGQETSRVKPRSAVGYPDDLAKIKGIGEVYKQRLYAAGIYTWHQIAHTDEETLRAATKAYPSSNVDEWAEQAQQMAEKHGRTGATYTGPRPNDLTRIYGIGPVGAATLYRAGICTYAQLAAMTPEDLAPLFPIAVAGDEPDFEDWIRQAGKMAEPAQGG